MEDRTLGLVWGVVLNKVRLRLEGTQRLTNTTSTSLREVSDLWKVIRKEHTHTHTHRGNLPSRKESSHRLDFYQIMTTAFKKKQSSNPQALNPD